MGRNMSTPVAFLELRYGKIHELDVHGLSLEEAKAEIIYTINKMDVFIKAILITHGYHQGTVLKNFIRKSFEHKNVRKKINIDASRTLLVLDLEN